ncbi:MAG: epimerase [Lentisphaerae bacterium RIFOXYB12_FULL_65_16]|nr:MAG: epimerase [Lentisphaerae bacterium RIFOXYA12_64_32]OGV90137.1 MAG: epimerase [Lentisphaerae bacterium RIFOXYB12_FULL_65_16]
MSSVPRPDIGTILVTGGTGYIGGRLVPELQARGYRVRVMVRAGSPELQGRWPGAEIVVADALKPETLSGALAGVGVAYYLIHSLLLGPREFESADTTSALNFRNAAAAAGVKRIIYLGGLGDTHTQLSAHLRSRMAVADALRGDTVPVTILRAAVIIGSGSASYDIIKSLVRRLPIVFIPPCAKSRCQPIAIRDVVRYLVGVLEVDKAAGKSFDIGGSDVLTYEEMLRVLARLLGRRCLFVPVPFAHIGFYSYLCSLLTPVPAPIISCLMEGLKNDVVCQDDSITRIVPFRPISYREAIIRALTVEEKDRVHTRWSDAYPPAHELAVHLRDLNGKVAYTASYSRLTDKSAAALFSCISGIGGKEGWFYSNWMWRLRGMVDRLLIGVGSSRGRRNASALRVNDVVDFWRVEDLKQDQALLLRAEMKLPGWAWLEFRIAPEGERRRLSVTAYYETKTLFGKLYWLTFLPFHFLIFNNLLKQIDRRSAT